MSSLKIVVATGQTLPSVDKPIHIAFYITPASPYATLPDRGPLVFRTLTFSGKPNEQQSISWPSSIYLGYYSLVASSGIPTVKAYSAEKIDHNRRYLKLGPDFKWKSEKLTYNPNPTVVVPPVLVLNDSGATQQFAFGHRHGEEIKLCVLLKPLDHQEGVYTTTSFTLQACQVPEHLRDGEHLDASSIKPIIKLAVDLSALRKDIQLWLHISNNVRQTCTLSYNSHPGENGELDSKRRAPPEPSPQHKVVNGGDKAVGGQGDEGVFIQDVELCEQDINIEQVRKIVMRSLHQSDIMIS